jgi:hypothetical protein
MAVLADDVCAVVGHLAFSLDQARAQQSLSPMDAATGAVMVRAYPGLYIRVCAQVHI